MGFFDGRQRLDDLSAFGDPLERLLQIVDFEMFRPQLESAFAFRSDKIKGGRPPYDAILIFKILVLQTLYTLSDDQTEYQIKDRLSFMRFLGLSLAHRVPDAKTIWLYRERLREKGLMTQLFQTFDKRLKSHGYLAMSGQILDASIVKAPRQRMTQEEKEVIKNGDIPEEWQEQPAKLAQKDRDARWMIKYSKAKIEKGSVDFAIPHFGYKNHISIDRGFGFIRRYEVTNAAFYDGHALTDLLDKENTAGSVWADTAYRNEKNEEFMIENGFRSQVHRKKPWGKKMPIHISRGNGMKSKIRARVEHVFAFQKEKMGLFVRTIGLCRAALKIGFANLVYNMKRLVFLEKRGPLTA
jgi:IS5 family transposase